MPECLPFDAYLDAIAVAAASLAADAGTAGLHASVPTCPEWTVTDLVAHQGVVHRWATANLRADREPVPARADILREVPNDHLIAWFEDGAPKLLRALSDAPPELAAMVFLNDAPAPRDFWARRQTHETTIHAVDALAARLGRFPAADEVAVTNDVALDGIDELLTGFFTRGTSQLAEDGPFTIAILPTGADRGWTLRVGDGRLLTERRVQDADATLSGSPSQLYLGLWNRGNEIVATGRPGVLERWRAVQQVRWR